MNWAGDNLYVVWHQWDHRGRSLFDFVLFCVAFCLALVVALLGLVVCFLPLAEAFVTIENIRRGAVDTEVDIMRTLWLFVARAFARHDAAGYTGTLVALAAEAKQFLVVGRVDALCALVLVWHRLFLS
jgi:hypothetical protein